MYIILMQEGNTKLHYIFVLKIYFAHSRFLLSFIISLHTFVISKAMSIYVNTQKLKIAKIDYQITQFNRDTGTFFSSKMYIFIPTSYIKLLYILQCSYVELSEFFNGGN